MWGSYELLVFNFNWHFIYFALYSGSHLIFEIHSCLCNGMCWKISFSSTIKGKLYGKLCTEGCYPQKCATVRGTCCSEQNFIQVRSGPFTVNRMFCQRWAMRHSKERKGYASSKTVWAAELAASKQKSLSHFAPQTRACWDSPFRSQTRTRLSCSRKDGCLPATALGSFYFDSSVLAETKELGRASKKRSNSNSFQIISFNAKEDKGHDLIFPS